MTISTLPAAPLPTDDRSTFNAKAFALVAALAAFVTEANALLVSAESEADAALASSLAAAASQTAALVSQMAAAASASAAAASAGAALWVSGTTYAVNDLARSPVNGLPYRRTAAGAGTTDPSADAANWSVLYAVPELVTAETYFLATT